MDPNLRLAVSISASMATSPQAETSEVSAMPAAFMHHPQFRNSARYAANLRRQLCSSEVARVLWS